MEIVLHLLEKAFNSWLLWYSHCRFYVENLVSQEKDKGIQRSSFSLKSYSKPPFLLGISADILFKTAELPLLKEFVNYLRLLSNHLNI